LVPIVIAIAIVAVAAYQATRPPARASSADVAAAKALVGDCLARNGGTSASPAYLLAAVSCRSASAAVKVVAVLVPRAGKSGTEELGVCPKGSAVAQVLRPGVVGEPFECLTAVPGQQVSRP
jgi:hypothetical protein